MWAPVMPVRAERAADRARAWMSGPDGEGEPGTHAEHAQEGGQKSRAETMVAPRRQTLVVTPLSVPEVSPGYDEHGGEGGVVPQREIGHR